MPVSLIDSHHFCLHYWSQWWHKSNKTYGLYASHYVYKSFPQTNNRSIDVWTLPSPGPSLGFSKHLANL